jgi:hypothetical protein
MSKASDLQARLDAVVIRYNGASARLAYLYANQTCLAPFPHQRAVDDALAQMNKARDEALALIALKREALASGKSFSPRK